MSFSKKLFSAALYLSLAGNAVQAQTIFAIPSQAGQATSVFSGEPFAQPNAVFGGTTTFAAFSNATGSKIYLVQESGSDTVLVLDGTNYSNILKRFNFGSNGEGAAFTSNGRRLLVAAGSLHVIDTTTDAEIATIAIGSTPVDVAASLDSTRAFVLSAAANTLTAVDLATNQVTGTPISIAAGATSVDVGPNGFVYVGANNRLYEIDPRSFTIRVEIPVNGRPGELVFTPDGKFAIAINETPISGTSILVFDLIGKTVAGTIPNLSGSFGNVVLNNLILVGNNRVYATQQGGGTMYEITLNPLSINAASYSGIEPLNVRVAAASKELSTPKYIFAATPTSLYRLTAANSLLVPSGQLGLTSLPIALLSTASTSTAAPTLLLAYNATQTLANTGGLANPLVIRALDATGNPVAGAPVAFSTSATDVTFSSVSTATDAQGYATANAALPGTPGVYTVTARAGGASGPTVTFNLTVSTGGGGTGGGGISIVSGNGQIVLEQFIVNDPLTVVVRDPSGVPIPGAIVTFQLTSGSGTLSPSTFGGAPTSVLSCQSNVCTATTDASGQASVGFVGASLFGTGLSVAPATISASAGSSSVNFTINTVLAFLQGQPAPQPTTALLEPSVENREITLQAGQTRPGAIQVQIVSSQGQPIVGAGVTVGSALDPVLFPPTQYASAACVGGTVLSDATGLATCDLVAGGRIGTGVPLRVNVGGFRNVGNLLLNVVAGPPAIARLVQGNNQSGNPGQRLPLAIVAEITDAGGNPLAGIQSTFEVISGSATLSNVFNTSDQGGRVSALVTLGTTAGPTQIRVRAGNASATFTVTTNVSAAAIARVSGDAQIAQINQAFGQPLVVAVTDAQGRPVSGVRVDFQVLSGSATLSSSSATTNASGNAQVSVTAGANSGSISVGATVTGGPSLTFGLTARLPGPVFTAQSFVNAASNSRGISPGSLAVIFVSGIAPNLRGCNMATNFGLGVLPVTLSNVQVQFGSTFAPIVYVCNIDGRESVAVQVPFEMAEGLAPVTIRVGEANTVVAGVQIDALSPGIFEHLVDGRRYAVLQRPDGSIVSNTNRAQRGERIRMYATGLGQTEPRTSTNRPGTQGQTVFAPVIVGVNNAGVNVISAETLPGVVGVYVVTFEIPSDAPSGDTQLAVAAVTGNNVSIRSTISTIAVQ